MVYNRDWPLSSHGNQWINWNWIQIKLNSSLLGNERQRSKYLSMFLLSFSVSKTNPAKICLESCSNIWQNFHLLLTYISSLQFMLFTISRIYSTFAITLTWIVQNYFQMLLYLVVTIIAIHFCMVSWTITSPNFSVFRIDWPELWQSHHHFTCSVPMLHSLR